MATIKLPLRRTLQLSVILFITNYRKFIYSLVISILNPYGVLIINNIINSGFHPELLTFYPYGVKNDPII